MQIDLTRRMKYEVIETDVIKKITGMCQGEDGVKKVRVKGKRLKYRDAFNL